MQCVFYGKNGLILKSDGNVDRNIFNNPDIVKAEFFYKGQKVEFDLTGGKRLIFYKDVTLSSPAETTFCVGYQKNVHGRNFKVIIKFKPDGSLEVCE